MQTKISSFKKWGEESIEVILAARDRDVNVWWRKFQTCFTIRWFCLVRQGVNLADVEARTLPVANAAMEVQ